MDTLAELAEVSAETPNPEEGPVRVVRMFLFPPHQTRRQIPFSPLPGVANFDPLGVFGHDASLNLWQCGLYNGCPPFPPIFPAPLCIGSRCTGVDHRGTDRE